MVRFTWTPEDDRVVLERILAHYEESVEYAKKIGFPLELLAMPPVDIPRRVYGSAPLPKRGRRLNPDKYRASGKRNYWR